MNGMVSLAHRCNYGILRSLHLGKEEERRSNFVIAVGVYTSVSIRPCEWGLFSGGVLKAVTIHHRINLGSLL